MPHTTVMKYGGAAMKDPDATRALASDLASLHARGDMMILVHGGGPEIDKELIQRGIVPRKIDGLRVTDGATMEVVEEVLARKVNPALVSLLQEAGVSAVGLAGKQESLLQIKKKPAEQGVDLGFVGEVTGVDREILQNLLAEGHLPVVCSVGRDSSGQAFNVNADEVACAIATTLPAEKLVFLTDVPGVYRRFPDLDSLIPQLGVDEAEAIAATIQGLNGMLPKISACVKAVKGGVKEARITGGPGRLVDVLQSGTKIS